MQLASPLTLPITTENVQQWFPAPHVENPFAGEPWWQIQSLGLLCALQLLRLIPPGEEQQQTLVELRRALDTGLLVVPAPTDEEIQRRMAQTLAPYAPTPFEVVDAMLDLANLKPGESLLDLGSGDGRIVFAAAKLGADAVGIEIDQTLVLTASERIEEDPAYRRATFLHGTIDATDWGTPDVVTCYLLSSSMEALHEKFRALRPGTRIISYAFGMKDWAPTRQIRTASGQGPIYLWVV